MIHEPDAWYEKNRDLCISNRKRMGTGRIVRIMLFHIFSNFIYVSEFFNLEKVCLGRL
jgi:hypothetical protein